MQMFIQIATKLWSTWTVPLSQTYISLAVSAHTLVSK